MLIITEIITAVVETRSVNMNEKKIITTTARKNITRTIITARETMKAIK